MTRRTAHRVLLAIPVLLLAGGAWGWWYLTDGRFPLAGDTSHDFGEVPIPFASASVDHTFSLRNRTDRTLEIEAVRPGCGCTNAEPSTRTIAPGETVDVDVTLTLGQAGRKRANVVLVLSGFGPQALWVEGVGRKETALATTVQHLALAPGAEETLVVTAAVQSSDAEPAPPAITAPAGVEAAFLDWAPVTKRDTGTRRAAQWRGRVTVVRTAGPPLPEHARLELALGEARLLIPVSDRPPPAAPGTPPASPPADR